MDTPEDPKVRSVMFLVSEIFLNLPADNNSGSLMQYLCNIQNAKLAIEDEARQEAIDVAFGHMNLDINFMKLIREWIYPRRLELHQTFESIRNERKRFVNIAVRFATQLFSTFKATSQSTYDLAINL